MNVNVKDLVLQGIFHPRRRISSNSMKQMRWSQHNWKGEGKDQSIRICYYRRTPAPVKRCLDIARLLPTCSSAPLYTRAQPRQRLHSHLRLQLPQLFLLIVLFDPLRFVLDFAVGRLW